MVRSQRGLTANRALDGMTAVEQEILTMFASGRSYAQIAEPRGPRPWTSGTLSTAFRTKWESIRNRRSWSGPGGTDC